MTAALPGAGAAPPRPGDVAVTGATGRVGAAVCAELLAHGHHVRRFGHAAGGAVQAIPIDVTSPESMAGSFDGCSRLIHCAGTFRAGDDDLAAVNALGTRHVAAEAAAAGVRYLLFVSTASAGAARAGTDPYVRSKTDAERELLGAGLPAAGVVRAGWVIGAADREAHAKLWPPSTRQVVLRDARVPVIALGDLAALIRAAAEQEIRGVIEGFIACPTQEELVEYAEGLSGGHRRIVRTGDPRLLARMARIRGGGGVYRDTYFTAAAPAVRGERARRARDLLPGFLSWQEAVSNLYASAGRQRGRIS